MRCQHGRRGGGPIGIHVDGFAEWLHGAGYKRRPGQLLLRAAAHLGHWCEACGSSADRMTQSVLESFVGHVPTCACPHAFRGRRRYLRYHSEGGRRFVMYLRGVGTVPSPATATAPVPPVVEQFGAWMRQHRGVQASTLGNYLPLVQEFVATLGDEAATYDATQVRAFVLARASRAGRSRAKSVVNAVRMFLRFLAVHGNCPTDLAAAVPRIANWRLASLPRGR